MNYTEKLNKAKGAEQLLNKQLQKSQLVLEELSDLSVYIDEAQLLIQTVAQKTQENLRYHIEDIVQLALDSCFPGKYEFIVNFELKRGRTEAVLLLQDKNGNKVNPMDAAGGGVVDITSFALRIAAWSLNRTNNTMILDEPFKNLSKDLISKGAQIIKELSKKLSLQFIIVTHIEELTEMADKIFEVELKDGVSQVKEIGNE